MALSDNLIAYYPLNGFAHDLAGNLRDGANHGAVTYVAGKRGLAADFSGSSAYISIPHSSWMNVSSITISFWMNPDAWSVDYTAVISKQQAASPYPVFDLRKTPGGSTLEAWLVVNGSGSTCYTPTNITTGAWQHIVFTYDAATHTATLYRNGSAGTPNTSFSGNLATNTTDIWFAGHPGSGARWFDGKLDDVAFWSRAITSTEVTELYNSGSGKSPLAQAVVFDMTCQETAGSLVDDTSSANDDGYFTISDAGDYTSAGPGGSLSKSFYGFDGFGDSWMMIGEYIELSYSLRMADDFGISWWGKATATGEGEYLGILYDAASTLVGIEPEGGSVICSVTLGSSWTPEGLTMGEWHHYCIARTNGVLTLRIDAGDAMNADIGGTSNYEFVSTSVGVGDVVSWLGNFCGIKAYNYAPSLAEIQADYAAGVSSGGGAARLLLLHMGAVSQN